LADERQRWRKETAVTRHIPGGPPEVTKAGRDEAEALWAALENDMPDSFDLNVVKPRVMEALFLAFCRGALLISQRGMDVLKLIDEEARKPIN
jgi:hypothetical protein